MSRLQKVDENIRRDRTLIIGDSVIKGINQNGLEATVDLKRFAKSTTQVAEQASPSVPVQHMFPLWCRRNSLQ